MPRVICDLPNASHLIRGVAFHPLEEGGLISDEIDEDLAAVFASIPGYSIADAGLEPVVPETKPAPKSRAAKKAADKEPPKPAPEKQPEAPQAHAGDDQGDGGEVF